MSLKISHEVPLCFLKESLEWNDYQYVLPHLTDQYPQYKTHMLEYREKPGSFIICDNGLFEGVTHTTEDLLEKINLIKPNIFIVPDAWNDATTTLVNAKSWIINYKQYLPKETNLMAVCQGKTMGELITTYQTLVDLGYTHIAFNHSSIAYEKEYESSIPKLKKQMYGRMELIRRLVEKNTIRKDIYHHLLGCSLPQEFMSYKDWPFIKSVDTSNPILVGAEGVRYHDSGINFKPEHKLEYYFEKNLEDKIEDIKFNVQRFKSFVK
jgi:hypothetical protein